MKFNFTLVCMALCILTSCSKKPQKIKTTSEEKVIDTVLMETNSLQKKYIQMHQNGIDFYAFGEKDTWTLTIDFEKEIQFRTKNGVQYTTTAVAPVLAQDQNIKRFRTKTEQGELIVQIIQSACIDSITQLKNKYQVRINYKAASDSDYIDFKGCGNYVPDYRLQDIWAIINVDGINIDPSTFNKNKPIVEIDITAERIVGADGCNTFRGSVYNETHKLYIGPLASTMMACIHNEEITQKINHILSSKNMQYKIQNNELQLFTNSEKRMTLKHID